MKLDRARELIGSFNKHKILVIGDVVLDHYLHGTVERLNPEAPVPILRVKEEREMTGGAGNVAKNAAQLGAKTVLVSVVGDDEAAARVAAAAKRENYRAVLVQDSSRPTTRKVRHLVDNQQMLRVDHEEVQDVSSGIEDQVIEALQREVAVGVDAIIVSDYAKGVITRRVAAALLDLAGKHDLLVAADIKPSRAPYVLGAAFVSPNIREAHEYVGVNYHEVQLAPADLAKMVYMKMCADVYLTLGKEGIYVYCGGETGTHVPQDNVVEVSDESGAGDTSVTVLLLSLLAGGDELEAARLANAAGAVAVSKVGSVGLSRHELSEMLARHELNELSKKTRTPE